MVRLKSLRCYPSNHPRIDDLYNPTVAFMSPNPKVVSHVVVASSSARLKREKLCMVCLGTRHGHERNRIVKRTFSDGMVKGNNAEGRVHVKHINA